MSASIKDKDKDKENYYKKFYNQINFNILYNNFSELINEYKDTEDINKSLENLIDFYFKLNNNKEEIRIKLNMEFYEKINIENLINDFETEKNNIDSKN
jgi:hypothetical protein